MIASRCWLLLALIGSCLPVLSFAQETCPWLDTATAAGILGGAVSTAVMDSKANSDETTCTFIREEDAARQQILIRVRRITGGKTLSRCRSEVPLRGIGNEAFACESKRRGKALAEQIVGRVRDRAFLVQASARGSSIKPEVLRGQAQRAAGQVSGNLF